MKKICKLFFAVCCALLISNGAFASAKLTGSGTNGSVYIVPTSADNDGKNIVTAQYNGTTQSSYTYDQNGGMVYYTVYAIPAHGYKFSKWSKSGNGSPLLSTENSNPVNVSQKSGNTTILGTTSTNSATITATFTENTSAAWNVVYAEPTEGGTYTVTGPTGYGMVTVGDGSTYETYNSDLIYLSAKPNSGSKLLRYVAIDADGNKTTLGTIAQDNQLVTIPEGTSKVSAEFMYGKFALFGDKTGSFDNLGDALQATRNSDGTYSGTIIPLVDAEVEAGYYTIQKGVTLLVPKNASQIEETPTIERIVGSSTYTVPAPYRKLTLKSGVIMDVFGTIEASGTQAGGLQGKDGTSVPRTTTGWIFMEEGSKITLQNGAVLRAWGWVTGKGEIDARRGSIVYEQFQIMDWAGGSNVFGSLIKTGIMLKAFPITQYYIQNVEVPTLYRPGSALITVATVTASSVNSICDNAKIIGLSSESALFQMDNNDVSEDTWVRKWYDAENDIQVYEVNNTIHLSDITISIGGNTLSSGKNPLPLTCNMLIHILSGEMDIVNDVMLLPGVQMEVDKEASIKLENERSLYIFDSEEWGTYVFNGRYGSQVMYSPTFNGAPNKRKFTSSDDIQDASINVHGTFNIEGNLYTTSGGANIFSNNEDAGTVIFKSAAPSKNASFNFVNGTGSTQSITAIPAKLRNDAQYAGTDDEFAYTSGTAKGKSYCYMNGKWTLLDVDPDNDCFVYDNYGFYYAKPGAYVAIAATKQNGIFYGNADHTFSDLAGENRLFILMDECQWWEVILEDNLYKGIVRNEDGTTEPNGKSYIYDEQQGKWVEKRYTITWLDYDGSALTDDTGNDIVYQLTYGAPIKYLSKSPTRPADFDYSYDFTGWMPAITDETIVTGDATYTATYAATPIKYTIRFLSPDGKEYDRQFLARGEMPTPPDLILTSGKAKYTWNPAVAEVTGNKDYYLEWLTQEEVDNKDWTITWQYYNGKEIVTSSHNIKNGTPAEDVLSTAPAKEDITRKATNEYEYVVVTNEDGSVLWQPTVTNATDNATYTAQFESKTRTYTITFLNEDGTEIEKGEYDFGTTPICDDTPTKPNDAQYTYTFAWVPQIQTVTGDATYKASFTPTTNKYSVSATSTIPGSCTFEGLGIFDYNADGHTITANLTAGQDYVFRGWKEEGSQQIISTEPTITLPLYHNLNLVAVVEREIVLGIEENRTISGAETYDVNTLVLNSNGVNKSSQVLNGEYLSVSGNAYFDLSLDNMQALTWYAVSVPFEIDAETGISIKDGRILKLGSDFDLVYHDGAVRAEQGPVFAQWVYVEYEDDKTMYPGKLYMMYFAQSIETIRFTKKEGSPITSNDDITLYAYPSAKASDAGWNCIANNRLYHAYVQADGIEEGQILVGDAYTTFTLSDRKFVLGQPVVVQWAEGEDGESNSITISKSEAPKRRMLASDISEQMRYELTFAQAGKSATSNIFIKTDDDKANEYEIGKDLAKAGVSSSVAQMWINRYNNRLCVNTQTLDNDQATYPLGLFAPKAGDYTISINNDYLSDAVLYLTYDGNDIWELSSSDFTISLQAGENNHYGLRLTKQVVNTPTQLVEQAAAANATSTKKLLIDGVVYIIREGEAYTINGQKLTK